MLANEWIDAAKKVTKDIHRGATWAQSTFQAMVDAGGQQAAMELYASDAMDSVLTAKTSAERHHQLADWVIHHVGRFATLRARAWKKILIEQAKDMEAAAKGGNMYPLRIGS